MLQIVEGGVFPIRRLSLPLRQVESIEVPVQATAEVMDEKSTEETEKQQQQPEQEQQRETQDDHHAEMSVEQQGQEQENRPHCNFLHIIIIS